jgi:hypothetical protein
MINKVLSVLLLVSTTQASFSQDTTAILNTAPRITASPEESRIAMSRVNSGIKNAEAADSMFSVFSLVGHQLWDKLKTDPSFKAMELSDVSFKIPSFDQSGREAGMTNVSGKVFQSASDFRKLWQWLYSNFDLSNAKITIPDQRDRYIFWLYFAKIEEPIVVIQTSKGRLLLKFVNGNLFFADLIA